MKNYQFVIVLAVSLLIVTFGVYFASQNLYIY